MGLSAALAVAGCGGGDEKREIDVSSVMRVTSVNPRAPFSAKQLQAAMVNNLQAAAPDNVKFVGVGGGGSGGDVRQGGAPPARGSDNRGQGSGEASGANKGPGANDGPGSAQTPEAERTPNQIPGALGGGQVKLARTVFYNPDTGKWHTRLKDEISGKILDVSEGYSSEAEAKRTLEPDQAPGGKPDPVGPTPRPVGPTPRPVGPTPRPNPPGPGSVTPAPGGVGQGNGGRVVVFKGRNFWYWAFVDRNGKLLFGHPGVFNQASDDRYAGDYTPAGARSAAERAGKVEYNPALGVWNWVLRDSAGRPVYLGKGYPHREAAEAGKIYEGVGVVTDRNYDTMRASLVGPQPSVLDRLEEDDQDAVREALENAAEQQGTPNACPSGDQPTPECVQAATDGLVQKSVEDLARASGRSISDVGRALSGGSLATVAVANAVVDTAMTRNGTVKAKVLLAASSPQGQEGRQGARAIPEATSPEGQAGGETTPEDEAGDDAAPQEGTAPEGGGEPEGGAAPEGGGPPEGGAAPEGGGAVPEGGSGGEPTP